MNGKYAVEVRDLSKSFDDKEVIRKWNLTIERNTIYCVLGKNGAGKTTFFKLLIGLVKPTYGKAKVFGYDCDNDTLEILKKTGSIIETPIFYEKLSATQNLEIHLEYMGAEYQNIQDILEMVGLVDVGEQPVDPFSIGMRQRLAIARALISKPNLLILDEPLNGMDPLGIREMRELFRELAKRNITIIFSSHILTEVEQVADYIIFIEEGKILEKKSVKEIKYEYSQGLEGYFMKMSSGGVMNEEVNKA